MAEIVEAAAVAQGELSAPRREPDRTGIDRDARQALAGQEIRDALGKLEAAGGERLIETVRGVGFVLRAEE